MKIEGYKFVTYGNSEAANTRFLTVFDFDPKKTALVLIDVWDDHPNKGWLARASKNVTDYLAPVLRSARASGLTIIHMPTDGHIHPLATPLPGEAVIGDSTQAVVDIVLSKGIETIFYAGYAANMCLMFKKAGLSYVSLHPSMAGKKYVVLSDATIGYENSETRDGEILKRAAIDSVIWDTNPSIASTNEQFFSAGFPQLEWKASKPMKASLKCDGTTLTLTAGNVGGVDIPNDLTLPATGLLASSGYHIHYHDAALVLDPAVSLPGHLRLGCMSTDSTGALRPFIQIGKEFHLKTSPGFWNGIDVSVYAARRVAPVPAGIKLKLDVSYASIGQYQSWIYLRDPDLAPPKLTDNAEGIDYHYENKFATGRTQVWCNESGQIMAHDRSNVGAMMTASLHGWTDPTAGTAD